MKEADRIDFSTLVWIDKQRFHLRGKAELAFVIGVTEWLDADAIPNQPKVLITVIPKGQREHSLQPFDDADPPSAEAGQDDFAVAVVSLPAVAKLFGELASKRTMIVDLAIEDEAESAIGRVHRLRRFLGQVDYGQPAMR